MAMDVSGPRCSSAFAFGPCTTSTAPPSLHSPSFPLLPPIPFRFPSSLLRLLSSFRIILSSFSCCRHCCCCCQFAFTRKKSVDINNNNNEQGEPWRQLLSPLPSCLLVALLPLSRPPLALLLLLVLLLVLRYST